MKELNGKTVLITGGTGLVGSFLAQELSASGYQVIILTRSRSKSPSATASRISYSRWNPAERFIDPLAIGQADYIVNLAGAGVADKRWTPSRKEEIIRSRVESAETVIQALKQTANKVKTVVNASAIGWYGPDPQIPNPAPFKETDPADKAFLGETVRHWEESISPVAQLSKRLVIFRIGIVLSDKGGALAEFLKPMRFGIAPVMGNGRQMVSWIHINDLCSLIRYALENEHINGVYNAVSPNPVSNRELIDTLARVKPGLQVKMPVPAFLLKIMLGEMSIEVLKSATVSSRKISEAGFSFRYPGLENAITSILKPS